MRRKDEKEICEGWEDISLASIVVYELTSLSFAFLAQKIFITFKLIYGLRPYVHVQTEILCLQFFFYVQKGTGHTYSIFPFFPITQSRNLTLFCMSLPHPQYPMSHYSKCYSNNLLKFSILITPTITALIQVLITS